MLTRIAPSETRVAELRKYFCNSQQKHEQFSPKYYTKYTAETHLRRAQKTTTHHPIRHKEKRTKKGSPKR
jgi:uncharacterized protein YeaO (DUF488 family)